MTKGSTTRRPGRRAGNILRVLVPEYIRSGRPVGSRQLAGLCQESLSPATIRSVTAHLEELGFLAQPHRSAGRVPTGMGYRFYADSLSKASELSPRELRRIREILEREMDPENLMDKTSQILSTHSDSMGFVLAQPLELAVMKHIQFVKVSARRVLVVVIAGAGSVQHRLVAVPKNLSQTDLDQAGRYLIRHFEGNTLPQIRDKLLSLTSGEGSQENPIKNAILLGSASLPDSDLSSQGESGVYLGGTAQIIEKPELADHQQASALLRALEKKSQLAKILTECLQAEEPGPTVTIGLDKHIPEMGGWAVISCPYLYHRQVSGSLGILGPARMSYEKGISLVGSVAKLFGRILSNN